MFTCARDDKIVAAFQLGNPVYVGSADIGEVLQMPA
jgi:hypothetical protein